MSDTRAASLPSVADPAAVLPSWLDDWKVRAGIIVALPFLIYAWSLSYGLTFLDDCTYYGNPALHGGSIQGLRELWVTSILGDYAPFAQLTIWLDLALFGSGSFVGARLHSLIWFGVGSLGVSALATRLTCRRNLGFACGLLYAAHPVCSVSVLWLAERKNLVSFALSMWAVERYLAAAVEPRKALSATVTSGVLFVLALLAKPHALAVLPMLAAYEAIQGTQTWLRRAVSLAPFAAVSAVHFLLSMHYRVDLNRPFLGGSRMAAVVSDGPILLRYLAHTVYPMGLGLYYFTPDLGLGAWQGWLAWSGAILIAAATVWVSRVRRQVVLAWLVGLAGLIPAINLVPQLAPMADHYLQWALPGFLVVAVLTVEALLQRATQEAGARRIAAGLVVASTALFGLVAMLRNVEFQSKKSIFATNIANQPDSALGWAGYAHGLIVERDANAGIAAIRALECADQYRILLVYRYLLAREAVATLKTLNDSEHAERILTALSRDISDRMVRLIRAESEVRAGHANEALQLLDPPTAETLAALEKVHAACRSGVRLPDGLPKLFGPANPLSGDEEHDSAEVELLVSPLLTRSFAYWTLANSEPREHASENLEHAFDYAALAVNLAPRRHGQRVLLAMIYRKMQLPEAAAALERGQPAAN